MVGRRLFIVRHQSPLRVIDEDEPLSAFSAEGLALPRTEEVVDTRGLGEDVEGGHWESSDAYCRQAADLVTYRLAKEGGELHYFGIAEVPHTLALGAYVGDEYHAHVHDFDRDSGAWGWPVSEPTVDFEIESRPVERVTQAGEITLAIEVSYAIDQADIDAIVGAETLSSIRVRPRGRGPAPGIIRSAEDVHAVRSQVREVLGAIAENRPGTTLIHLFVAAPMSVCFAVGQELRLRNGRDVQTYRFRADDLPRYSPALLLTTRAPAGASRILSEEEKVLAIDLRAVFRDALEDLKAQAARLASKGPWYEALKPADHLHESQPFSLLAPLSNLVGSEDEFSDIPRAVDYGFEKEPSRHWKMSDHLVLSFYAGAGEDRDQLRHLARLFFYHEYLHDSQNLTKYTAEDVGSFANCLEAIDYMADTYALLHQLDFAIHEGSISSDPDCQRFLKDQIQLAIASFWGFEPPPPNFEWQERRLRRYLNWYWRRVQMREAPDFSAALRTLARRPSIEIAGFVYRTGGGRHYVLLNKPRIGDVQEIGVVLEDGRFMRRGSSTDLGVEEVMRAFGEHDREAIDRFFQSLMEHAKQSGAVYARK